jgi:hypothetical protein
MLVRQALYHSNHASRPELFLNSPSISPTLPEIILHNWELVKFGNHYFLPSRNGVLYEQWNKSNF